MESKIVENNSDGEVSKCIIDDKVYYNVTKNAYDAVSIIVDAYGVEAGVCNYAFDQVDAMCSQLNQCKTIYRISPNIWGTPGVVYEP